MEKNKMNNLDFKKIQEAALRYFSELKEKVSAKDIDKVKDKLSLMKRGPLKEVWGKVMGLYHIVRDKDIDLKDKIGPLAALVYVITPIDIIPDGIPFAGLIDDVAVVGYMATVVYNQVSKMKKNKEQVANEEIISVGPDNFVNYQYDDIEE